MDKKLTVVYIAHAMSPEWGGATMSLCNLISSIIDRIIPIVISCEDGLLLSKLRDMGVRCIVANFRLLWLPQFAVKDYRKKFPYLFMHYLWNENKLANEVARALQGEHVDVVHSNSSVFSFGHTLSRKLNAKHVWHIREFGDLDFSYEIFGGRHRLTSMINKADARITISTAIAKHWHLKDDKTFTVGNAVREASNRTIIRSKGRYFLFCAANVTVKKGVFTAIEGFAKSGMAVRGYQLHIYGKCDDWIRTEIEALSCKFNLQHDVKLLGFKDNLNDVYSNATAFIMASESEGLGRVTIEAMFEGCPVIARKSGGSLDLIEEDKTGFFFETADDLALNLRRVAMEDVATVIENAQRFANNNFIESVYADKIMDIYGSLMRIK